MGLHLRGGTTSALPIVRGSYGDNHESLSPHANQGASWFAKTAAVLAVERYAETLATLHHLRSDQRSAYLAGLGLTAEAWDTADRAWTELLTCAGRPGDGALALAFAVAFARVLMACQIRRFLTLTS